MVALRALPLVGRGIPDKLRALIALARAVRDARKTLRQFGAQAVVAVGGYASVAPALAGRTLGLPVVLVNVDAAPGLANRLVARFASRICVAFEAGRSAFGDDARVCVTGAPLREALVERFRNAATTRPDRGRAPQTGDPPRPQTDDRRETQRDDRRMHLFVFGGSQGAEQLNEAMIELAPKLANDAWRIVHQTGERDRDRVAAAYAAAGIDAEVVAFERDMPRRYAEADLVLCRAGAISVAELGLAGRPALLAPLVHVGGGEQVANAREVERCGAGRVLDTQPLDAGALHGMLEALAQDRETLAAMARAAAGRGRPDAADRVLDEALALIGERSTDRIGAGDERA